MSHYEDDWFPKTGLLAADRWASSGLRRRKSIIILREVRRCRHTDRRGLGICPLVSMSFYNRCDSIYRVSGNVAVNASMS